MSSNSAGLTVNGSAYQAIIIGLLAGGILSTGAVAVLYRRRRRREFLLEVERREANRTSREWGWIVTRSGEVLRVPDFGQAGAGGVVWEPKIWDAWVGRGDEDADGVGGGADDGGVGDDQARRDRAKAKERMREATALEEHDVIQREKDGQEVVEMGAEDWSPLCLGFPAVPVPPHTASPRPDHVGPLPTLVELSVLIAMPSPSSSFPSTPMPHAEGHTATHDSSRYRPPLGAERSDELPILEIASAQVPLRPKDAREKDNLENMWRELLKARADREADVLPGGSAGRSSVRADGFRRPIGT